MVPIFPVVKVNPGPPTCKKLGPEAFFLGAIYLIVHHFGRRGAKLSSPPLSSFVHFGAFGKIAVAARTSLELLSGTSCNHFSETMSPRSKTLEEKTFWICAFGRVCATKPETEKRRSLQVSLRDRSFYKRPFRHSSKNLRNRRSKYVEVMGFYPPNAIKVSPVMSRVGPQFSAFRAYMMPSRKVVSHLRKKGGT